MKMKKIENKDFNQEVLKIDKELHRGEAKRFLCPNCGKLAMAVKSSYDGATYAHCENCGCFFGLEAKKAGGKMND